MERFHHEFRPVMIRSPYVATSLLAAFLLCGDLHAQSNGYNRLSATVRTGLAFPVGLLADNESMSRQDMSDFVGGRARSGFGLSLQAEYRLTSVIGMAVWVDHAGMKGAASYIGWHPMNCLQCFGSGPTSYTRVGKADGTWQTTNVLAGPVVYLSSDPVLAFRGGVGMLHVGLPGLHYQDEGIWRHTGVPNPTMAPYLGTMVRSATSAQAMAFGFGLDLQKRLTERLELSVSLGFRSATIRTTGTDEVSYQYFGHAEDRSFDRSYDELRPVSYVLIQAGLSYGWFRPAAEK